MDILDQNTSSEVLELQNKIRELEQRIARLQRERSVYAAKTRLLTEELEKYRSRELRQDTTVDSLLQRQQEMNVMLNRSNIMLAKAQNATAMLSLEFGELARALPETVSTHSHDEAEVVTAQVDDKIQRINDLFRKTGELSEEIAETLHGAQKASEPQQSASPPPPPPSQPTQQAYAPPSQPEPQQQTYQPPPQPEKPTENADESGSNHHSQVQETPIYQQEATQTQTVEQVEQTSAQEVPLQETADITDEEQPVEAEEVILTEEPEAIIEDDQETQAASFEEQDTISYVDLEAESVTEDHPGGVPRPRDIFYRDRASAKPSSKSSQEAKNDGKDPSHLSASEVVLEGELLDDDYPAEQTQPEPDRSLGPDAEEFLDRLVAEQEESENQKRKGGFFRRLLGG